MSQARGPSSPGAAALSGDESLELPEFDAPPQDPIELLRRWFALAEDRDVREPKAVSLATVDERGRPSTRTITLKDVDDDGSLLFTTHTTSRKGHHLTARPWASMNFYWRETLQQLVVSGPVERLPAARSDALFAERPVAAQATTAVSEQSAALVDEAALHERATALADTDGPLERPARWGGYRLLPDEIEFWAGRSSRLHRRLVYTRLDTAWSHRRVQP